MKKRVFLFLLLMLLGLSASAEEFGEVELFAGRASAIGSWQVVASIATTPGDGDFDPNLIAEGTCFAVEYIGMRNQVSLALADAATGKWSQITIPAKCEALKIRWEQGRSRFIAARWRASIMRSCFWMASIPMRRGIRALQRCSSRCCPWSEQE